MSDEKELTDAQYIAAVSARESAVDSLLSKKDKKGALIAALQSPPVATKDMSIKDRNSAIVEKVIGAITDTEVQGLIDALDQDALDVLMKYLYRIMGKIDKSVNYALLLKMHAIVSDKAGMGTIVRSLTERKQV